tara:strand:+ start:285 stop:482 length:198 start_codon:yes stop_codon:yes gene_type:complete
VLAYYNPEPGDLVKYLSRTLLVIDKPYPANASWNELWVETIEIDENTLRKVRCANLTLIQRAQEK